MMLIVFSEGNGLSVEDSMLVLAGIVRSISPNPGGSGFCVPLIPVDPEAYTKLATQLEGMGLLDPVPYPSLAPPQPQPQPQP